MKTPTLPHVGLPADELLKLRGRAKEDASAPPTRVRWDKQGQIIDWHYPDCDVRLHYRNGCYRIAAVDPKEAPDATTA